MSKFYYSETFQKKRSKSGNNKYVKVNGEWVPYTHWISGNKTLSEYVENSVLVATIEDYEAEIRFGENGTVIKI